MSPTRASDGTNRNSARCHPAIPPVHGIGDIVLAPNGADLNVGVVEGPVEYRPGGHTCPGDEESIGPTLMRRSLEQRSRRPLLEATDAVDPHGHQRGPGRAHRLPRARSSCSHRLHQDCRRSRPSRCDREAGRRAPFAPIVASTPDRPSSAQRQLVFYGPPGTGRTFDAQGSPITSPVTRAPRRSCSSSVVELRGHLRGFPTQGHNGRNGRL